MIKIDLTKAKVAKLANLEQSRKQAIDTLPPVTVAGKQYPATPEYILIVSNLARRLAAGRPVPSELRTIKGERVPQTAALVSQIDDAIAAAIQAQRDKYWSLFDLVQAATTVEAVTAIVW